MVARLEALVAVSLAFLALLLPAVVAAPACTFPGFDAAVSHFSKALQFKTVSDPDTADHARDPAEFEALDAHLSSTYASVWEKLRVEKVGINKRSYLITWPGSDPSLLPVLFISHVDVVPVPEESIKDWTYPPFSGKVADGYIWGRGSLDVKVSAIALLEAATALLAEGYSPRRTLIFAFGQDEEVGGACGAAETAKLLASRGVQLEVIWDEGSSVLLDGVAPLIRGRPVALVATAEKGYQSVQVHVRSAGGHSSMPPIDGSSVGSILGKILQGLDGSPPQAQLLSPVKEFLQQAAPYASAWLSPLLAVATLNKFTSDLVARFMAQGGRETAALVRMTAAPTIIQAGVADNVLPQQGHMNINFRLLPGQSQEAPLDYLKGLLNSKDQAVVEFVLNKTTGNPPSVVTAASGPHFQLLKQAVQEVWEEDGEPIPVLPFLMPGGTDSKHYGKLSRHGAMRFVPYGLTRSGIKGVHGTNERVPVEGFRKALCVYRRGLELFGGHDAGSRTGGAGGAQGGPASGAGSAAGGGQGGRRGKGGFGDGVEAAASADDAGTDGAVAS